MSRQVLGYVFFGIGFAAMIFVLARTYYRLWTLKKNQGIARQRVETREPEDGDH